jgi:hypothetical protein
MTALWILVGGLGAMLVLAAIAAVVAYWLTKPTSYRDLEP